MCITELAKLNWNDGFISEVATQIIMLFLLTRLCQNHWHDFYNYEIIRPHMTYEATAACKDNWFIAMVLLDWSTGFGVVVVVDVLVAFPPAAAPALSNGSGVRVGMAGMVVGGPRMIAYKQG